MVTCGSRHILPVRQWSFFFALGGGGFSWQRGAEKRASAKRAAKRKARCCERGFMKPTYGRRHGTSAQDAAGVLAFGVMLVGRLWAFEWVEGCGRISVNRLSPSL
jgi:hypothetical protein